MLVTAYAYFMDKEYDVQAIMVYLSFTSVNQTTEEHF